VVGLRPLAEERGVTAILETEGLTKSFGAVTAAGNITVRFDEDTIVGLIGGNGAGKTTFLNLVTGYQKPSAGVVRFSGADITGLAPRQITRLGICRSFQIPQVFDSLTTYENLLVGLGIVKLGRGAFVGSALGDRPGAAPPPASSPRGSASSSTSPWRWR
jgi:branched-chain amino acid transport system ATP-binding protein